MLQLQGKCTGVQSEQRQGPSGPFTSTDIGIQTGPMTIDRVRVGRDFKPEDYPKEGEDVTLVVVASAYKTKDGTPRVQFTATGRVRGSRIAAAS